MKCEAYFIGVKSAVVAYFTRARIGVTIPLGTYNYFLLSAHQLPSHGLWRESQYFMDSPNFVDPFLFLRCHFDTLNIVFSAA
jgi:hypothetical protein